MTRKSAWSTLFSSTLLVMCGFQPEYILPPWRYLHSPGASACDHDGAKPRRAQPDQGHSERANGRRDVAVAEKRPLRTAAFPPLSRIDRPGLELVTRSKHEPALLF